jgi:hypothetical protein
MKTKPSWKKIKQETTCFVFASLEERWNKRKEGWKTCNIYFIYKDISKDVLGTKLIIMTNL